MQKFTTLLMFDGQAEPPDAPLPDTVTTGAEPLRILGAMAGG